MAENTDSNENRINTIEMIPIFLNESGSRIGRFPNSIILTRQNTETAMILGFRSGSMAEGTIRKGKSTNRKAKKKVAALLVFTFRHIFSSTYRITVQFTKSFEKL